MASFISTNPHHAISHASLKQAAGDETFVLRFAPHPDEPTSGVFETENEAVATALTALVDAGNLPNVKAFAPDKKGK